jgi:ATP-dependent Clp protease ATP-binding subunit ClpA
MFERFDGAARQAVVDARQEAGWAGQDQIGSEHILVGLLSQPGPAADALSAAGLDVDSLRTRLPRGTGGAPDSLDADALATLGIDLDAVRRAADASFGPGALDRARRGRARLLFAADARQALASALRHAQQQSSREISSGHLLLGILDQRRGAALTVLTEAGAEIPALRADVLRRIGAVA